MSQGDNNKEAPEDQGAKEDGDTDLTPADTEVPEAIKAAPPQVKRVWEMMATTLSAGQLPHPLFEKLESSHIDKFLDYSHEDSRREHEHRRVGRWFQLVYFFSLLLAVFALIWILLPSNQPLLQDIIKILVAFAGGFGAGYGYRASRRSDR